MSAIDGVRVKLAFAWAVKDVFVDQRPVEWEEGSGSRTLWAGHIPIGRVTSDGVWWHVIMFLPGRPKKEMTYRHPEIAAKKAERFAKLWADNFLAGSTIRNSVDSE